MSNRMNFGRGYINCDWISLPRMTNQERNELLTNPEIGMLIDNSDTNTMQRYNGSVWEEVGSGSSAPVSSYESVTYSELVTLISANGLIVGMHYLISDYVTTYTQPVTGLAMSGTIEPLLVQAQSNNELKPIAYSALFPHDVIYYEVDSSYALAPIGTGAPRRPILGATKGFIYRRIDTIQNNDFCFDFRQVKFRRWNIATSVWNSATTYARLDGIHNGSQLYISKKDGNINNALNDQNWWTVFNLDNSQSTIPTSGFFIDGLSGNSSVFNDYHFCASSENYDKWFNNKVVVNCEENILANVDTVVFSSDFVNNEITCKTFSGNTILSNFKYNYIYGNGIFSTIINSCENNKINYIGRSILFIFNNNIQNNFANSNYVFGFEGNHIKGTLSYNVGEFARHNTIDENFANNTWNLNFENNTIGANTMFNQFGQNCQSNIIGAGYGSGVSQVGFYNNVIGDAFSSNTTQGKIHNNTIDSNFSFNIQNGILNNCTIGINATRNTFMGSISSKDFTSVASLTGNGHTQIESTDIGVFVRNFNGTVYTFTAI